MGSIPVPGLGYCTCDVEAMVVWRCDARHGGPGHLRAPFGLTAAPEDALRAQLDPRLPSVAPFERQHGARSGGRSLAIRSKMRPNSSRGTATSAIWKTRQRCETTFAPIFTTFSRRLVSDHCAIS